MMLAASVGARRAAMLTDRPARRVTVFLRGDEGPGEAEALGAWLDAQAPRSRAERAAAGPAPISLVSWSPVGEREGGPPALRVAGEPSEPAPDYRCLPVPGSGGVVLGFEFPDRARADELAGRLPPNLTRHASVALALVGAQALEAAELARLRARDEERTRFVSTVAHELRTPLTGLGGYLDLILEGRVPDPLVERDFLERGRGTVESMAGLVGDLLEISRIDSGNLALEISPFSVAEATARVVGQLEPIALNREITIRTDVPPRLQVAVADRRRVEQILTNLIGNALKFSPPKATVLVDAWLEGALMVWAVRDVGPGIGPDDRARIFDRYVRLTGHHRIAGTGLGLPIARELAQAMGGELGVASVTGSGSSFVLVLPGPGPVPARAVPDCLNRAIAIEEQALEERAVITALRSAGQTVPALRVVPGQGRRNDQATGEAPESGGARRREALSTEDPAKPTHEAGLAYRLRSIDGALAEAD